IAADDLVPPAINQPESFKTFGRPIGTRFQACMNVKPSELRLDSSLTLTILITYKGDAGEAPQQPPRPPILDEAFASAFAIGSMTEDSDRFSWRFSIQLTPLSEKVDHIPALLFTYYSPL